MEDLLKKNARQKDQTNYAHNAHYCMIRPSAQEDEEDIVSTGQS